MENNISSFNHRLTDTYFEKVSFKEYKKSWLDKYNDKISISDEKIREFYDAIKLPRRATEDSAGYDFYAPISYPLNKGDTILIPTGIRCHINQGWVLMIYPRSGMGFKTGTHLANSTGVIDADYYYADNEGHIFVKLCNDTSLAKDIKINRGDAFCQGVFLPYGITVNDSDTEKEVRTGGFGSTDKK